MGKTKTCIAKITQLVSEALISQLNLQYFIYNIIIRNGEVLELVNASDWSDFACSIH